MQVNSTINSYYVKWRATDAVRGLELYDRIVRGVLKSVDLDNLDYAKLETVICHYNLPTKKSHKNG